jgi:hypothetical protein
MHTVAVTVGPIQPQTGFCKGVSGVTSPLSTQDFTSATCQPSAVDGGSDAPD